MPYVGRAVLAVTYLAALVAVLSTVTLRAVNRLCPGGSKHQVQLERWCRRLGIDTPEILRHEYTDAGECYWLRVTGRDEDGYVLTPETFAGLWPKFRAVAGDDCHGVWISRPDRRHGGRCTMEINWRDGAPRYVEVVQISANESRYAYSAEEADELRARSFATWAPPNPAEMVGEG